MSKDILTAQIAILRNQISRLRSRRPHVQQQIDTSTEQQCRNAAG